MAVIWFLFKLPHEWWIHIAQLDATDFIKVKILGASAATSFWRAIIEAPAVTGSLIFVAAILVMVFRRYVHVRRSQAAEAKTAGEAPKARIAHWTRPVTAGLAEVVGSSHRLRQKLRVAILRGHTASNVRPKVLIEKIVIVTVVAVIFQQVLPGLEANGVQTALFIALAIIATDFLLRWVVRRFGIPISPGVDLFVTAVLNFFFVIVFQLIIPFISPKYNLASVLIFASLITLFVTLYDHYRPIYDARVLLDREVIVSRRASPDSCAIQ